MGKMKNYTSFNDYFSKTEIIDIAKKASVSDWFGSKRQGLHRARGESGKH